MKNTLLIKKRFDLGAEFRQSRLEYLDATFEMLRKPFNLIQTVEHARALRYEPIISNFGIIADDLARACRNAGGGKKSGNFFPQFVRGSRQQSLYMRQSMKRWVWNFVDLFEHFVYKLTRFFCAPRDQNLVTDLQGFTHTGQPLGEPILFPTHERQPQLTHNASPREKNSNA